MRHSWTICLRTGLLQSHYPYQPLPSVCLGESACVCVFGRQCEKIGITNLKINEEKYAVFHSSAVRPCACSSSACLFPCRAGYLLRRQPCFTPAYLQNTSRDPAGLRTAISYEVTCCFQTDSHCRLGYFNQWSDYDFLVWHVLTEAGTVCMFSH